MPVLPTLIALIGPRLASALGGSGRPGEVSPLAGIIPMALVFVIFWFVLIMPTRNKQKKLDELVKALKSGDKVIVNPGIFGTIVGVEDGAFHVRVDDKTKIKVLKSAISGLQEPPPQMEKK